MGTVTPSYGNSFCTIVKYFYSDYKKLAYIFCNWIIPSNSTENGWRVVVTDFTTPNFFLSATYSMIGVDYLNNVNIIAPNIILANNNPPIDNPAQLGNSMLIFLVENVQINIIGGYCGLPNLFNVASSNLIYNSTELGLAFIGILDSEGMGLAVITVSLSEMTCSSFNAAPIINLHQKLSDQNGFIPLNAVYDNFFVVAASISKDLMSIQATLLLRIANAPIYQFTIDATLNSQ